MKKAIVWLLLAGVGGAGCLTADKEKSPPAAAMTEVKKTPIKPVTAEDVTAANAREAADKLRMELDRESGKTEPTGRE